MNGRLLIILSLLLLNFVTMWINKLIITKLVINMLIINIRENNCKKREEEKIRMNEIIRHSNSSQQIVQNVQNYKTRKK